MTQRAVLVLACMIAFANTAAAQSLVGQWATSNTLPSGGMMRATVNFQPDGSFHSQTVMTGSPVNNPMGYGSGVVNCEARYSFDGQMLHMTTQQCISPGLVTMPPMPGLNGPVVFAGPNQASIAGDLYLRMGQ
jgi:hypothetical protein